MVSQVKILHNFHGHLFNPNWHESIFFNTLLVGDVFTYHPDCYLLRNVIELGKQKGFILEYCHPTSVEYKTHGCYAVKVVGLLISYKEAGNG